MASIQKEITATLEAGTWVALMQHAQARQIGALRGFLLSGDERFRTRYWSARSRQDDAHTELARITAGLGGSIRTRMADVTALSLSWQMDHRPILEPESRLGDPVPDLAREEELYDELVEATRRLREAIAGAAEEGRVRMEAARLLQLRITVALVALALGATLAVAFLGRRLRMLIGAAEARRREAVGARREADAVLKATAEGVMGVDLEGKCTFLTPAGAALLRYPAARIMGRDVHSLVHPSRSDGTPCEAASCPVFGDPGERRESGALSDHLLRADGTRFPARISRSPMVDGREVRGSVVTFIDLTEVLEAEKALRRALQARDDVLAIVSHDLRNPLGTISAAADLMLDVALAPETERRHLAIIRRSSRRMNRLIEDLLDVARMEKGAFSIDPSPVDMDSLLREAHEAARPVAESKRLDLRRRGASALPPVHGDRDRILQVLSNLVDNAVKFTPAGGEIVLAAAPADGEVSVAVEDTGHGIAPEDQEHLFDRFWQANRASETGAGLGLAIVKGIVDAHGGRVWVESTPGQGSIVRFTIPVSSS